MWSMRHGIATSLPLLFLGVVASGWAAPSTQVPATGATSRAIDSVPITVVSGEGEGKAEGGLHGDVIETEDGSYVDLDSQSTRPLMMDWWTDTPGSTNGFLDKMNGARNFRHIAYPHRNVARGDSLFNVEFIGNGEDVSVTGGYVDGGVALPRTHPKTLTSEVDDRGRVKGIMQWEAEEGEFPLDITYTARMKEHGRVDFTFEMTPREDVFPRGWLAVFFASYIDKAREQAINFPGYREVDFGWISYGSRFRNSHHPEYGKECGVVQHWNAPELTFDSTLDGFAWYNYRDNSDHVEFSLPFWYGILDGDGDLGTTNDNMFYGMLFDLRKRKNVQFTTVGFFPADDSWNGKVIWDWSIVDHNPQIGKEFKIDWRVVYKPIHKREGESLHEAARRMAVEEWLSFLGETLVLLGADCLRSIAMTALDVEGPVTGAPEGSAAITAAGVDSGARGSAAIMGVSGEGKGEDEGKRDGKVMETRDGNFVDLDSQGTHPLMMDWWTDNPGSTNGCLARANGARNFRHIAYPRRNVVGDSSSFCLEYVGNGEDVSVTGGYVNGGVALPRIHPKTLTSEVGEHGAVAGILEWEAEKGEFPLDITYTAMMRGHGRVDFTFEMTPREDVFPHGWLAVFFASHIGKAREQAINFLGYREDDYGWISYGSRIKDPSHPEYGMEDGVIQHRSAPELTFDHTLYDSGGYALWNYWGNFNRVDFSLPFWYGILDGDGNPWTTDDNMFYGMFFDVKKRKNVQFTPWSSFPADDSWNGEAVWDWSIVDHNPRIGKKLKTNWRVVYRPIEQRDGESLHKAARRMAVEEWLSFLGEALVCRGASWLRSIF